MSTTPHRCFNEFDDRWETTLSHCHYHGTASTTGTSEVDISRRTLKMLKTLVLNYLTKIVQLL